MVRCDRIRPLTDQLARHQRAFSIYETFNEGRLTDRTTLLVDGAATRVQVPLYRSFLEIEHIRDEATGAWTFAFIAFAVTGEENTDTNPGSPVPPKVIDAFEVGWADDVVTFSVTPAG